VSGCSEAHTPATQDLLDHVDVFRHVTQTAHHVTTELRLTYRRTESDIRFHAVIARPQMKRSKEQSDISGYLGEAHGLAFEPLF
jgi:hypothetical protein